MLRTIRLDASDERVFERAADPDEWAVSGAFAFADLPAEALTGKTRQAFASGFLGTTSFGRASLVAVAEIDEAGRAATIERLARHLVACYGAPSLIAALPAAADEVGFAADLCAELPVNTLLAVSRNLGEDGIRETFRTIVPARDALHAPVFGIVADDD